MSADDPDYGRMLTNYAKSQPEWEVERIGSKLGLTCPHCKSKTLVNRARWIKGLMQKTMSNMVEDVPIRHCPYCWSIALVPRRLYRRM